MSIVTGPVLPPRKPKPSKPKPKPLKLDGGEELYLDWDAIVENVDPEDEETWLDVVAYVIDEEDDTKTGFARPENGEYLLENQTNYVSIENGKISNFY